MKRRYYLIFKLLILVFVTHPTLAQKPTKEQKALISEWKKKMSSMDPLEFKRIVEERDSLQKKVSDMEEGHTACKTQLEQKQAEVEQLRKEVDSLKSGPVVTTSVLPGSDITSARVDSTRVDNNTESQSDPKSFPRSKKIPSRNIVYKVQIGIFKNKNLEKYIYNNKFFNGDVDKDGARKYTLGYFTDYWEADNFKKYMRAMGVNDAWIVAYKDGERVNIKDALEGVL